MQRQDARDAQADLAGTQEAQRLANLSGRRSPAIPTLTSVGHGRGPVDSDLGYAVPEAVDAIHWALQDMGVQYDVAPDTPTAARFGPGAFRASGCCRSRS